MASATDLLVICISSGIICISRNELRLGRRKRGPYEFHRINVG